MTDGLSFDYDADADPTTEELDAQEAAFLAHQADDPHCICNDCLSDYARRMASMTDGLSFD